MNDFGDSVGVGFILEVLVYCFSWAIGLAVAARYVFGSTKSVAVCWFYAGFAINVVIGILIPMGMSEIETGSTMIAMGGGWGLPGMENNDRLSRLHKGIVAIPILAVTISTAYMAFRSMMLNRESDEEETQVEE